MLEAQEQERTRLAEELHDGPAQTLSNAVFRVRIVERAMRSDRHFWATLNYAHHNPVHHGYVARWTDWPWPVWPSTPTTAATRSDGSSARAPGTGRDGALARPVAPLFPEPRPFS